MGGGTLQFDGNNNHISQTINHYRVEEHYNLMVTTINPGSFEPWLRWRNITI
jgi:hypothetical protein